MSVDKMRCAYCGKVKQWTRDFPYSHRAQCWTCLRERHVELVRRERKRKERMVLAAHAALVLGIIAMAIWVHYYL